MACPVCQSGSQEFGFASDPGAYGSQTCSCSTEDSIKDSSTTQAGSLKREDMEVLQQELKNMQRDITRLESAQTTVTDTVTTDCLTDSELIETLDKVLCHVDFTRVDTDPDDSVTEPDFDDGANIPSAQFTFLKRAPELRDANWYLVVGSG